MWMMPTVTGWSNGSPVLPSYRIILPVVGSGWPVSRLMRSASAATSSSAASRCVPSRHTWPRALRGLGTACNRQSLARPAPDGHAHRSRSTHFSHSRRQTMRASSSASCAPAAARSSSKARSAVRIVALGSRQPLAQHGLARHSRGRCTAARRRNRARPATRPGRARATSSSSWYSASMPPVLTAQSQARSVAFSQARSISQARASSASISSSSAPSNTGVIGPEAQAVGGPAQVRLQDLADVHAAGHAQRVQDDVHRRAVGQEGHVLDRHDLGDDALVAVAAGHLVAFGELAALRHADAHHLSTPAGRSRCSSRVKILDVHDLAVLAVRQAQARSPSPRAPSRRRWRAAASLPGVSSVSPLGVILPTRMSPGATSAPMRMMPSSSRSFSASSPTLGMSRVISSGPSLVSRASISCFSMWIEVNLSSLDQPLADQDGVFVVAAFPAHEGHQHVLAQRQLAVSVELESASTSPFSTRSPLWTTGRWSMQVLWLERLYLRSG